MHLPLLFHLPVPLPLSPHHPFLHISHCCAPPTLTLSPTHLPPPTPPSSPSGAPLNLSLFPRPSSQALTALHHFYTNLNALPHPGTCAHHLGRATSDFISVSRQTIAQQIHAPSPTIFFSPSIASLSVSLTHSFSSTLRKNKNQVIITPTHHDPLLLAWRSAAKRFRLKLRVPNLQTDSDPHLSPLQAVASLVSSRTSLIVLRHGCDLLGCVHDIREISEFAASAGIPVLIDATASMPFRRIDIRKLPCDMLIGGGEGLGVPGGGVFVYGTPEILRRIPPWEGGESSWEQVQLGGKGEWGEIPARFEMGMASVAVSGAAAAAVTQGMGERSANGVGQRLREVLNGVEGVKVLGNANDDLLPMVCFCVDGVHEADVGRAMQRRGVIADVGSHGAAVAHREIFGIEGSVRIVAKGLGEVARVGEVVREVVAELTKR